MDYRRMNASVTQAIETANRLAPTPNEDDLPRRFADFATFGEALDYADRKSVV